MHRPMQRHVGLTSTAPWFISKTAHMIAAGIVTARIDKVYK